MCEPSSTFIFIITETEENIGTLMPWETTHPEPPKCHKYALKVTLVPHGPFSWPFLHPISGETDLASLPVTHPNAQLEFSWFPITPSSVSLVHLPSHTPYLGLSEKLPTQAPATVLWMSEARALRPNCQLPALEHLPTMPFGASPMTKDCWGKQHPFSKTAESNEEAPDAESSLEVANFWNVLTPPLLLVELDAQPCRL